MMKESTNRRPPMSGLLLVSVVQLLMPASHAAPTGGDRSVDALLAEEVFGMFQVHRTATDLAVVGRHVVGDVTVEIEALPSVDLQVQWAALVAAPTSSQNTGWYQQRMLSANSSEDSELQLLRFPSAMSGYMVPIVGDSWCSIQETSWSSTDSSRKHLTSTLNCRHLPSTTSGINHNPEVNVIVRAHDGAVQYQRHMSNNDATNRPQNCFDWRLTDNVNAIPRTRLIEPRASISFNFSIILRCNISSLPLVKLTWISDNEALSLDWVAVGSSLQADAGNGSAATRCRMQEQFVRVGNWSESALTTVDCAVMVRPDELGYDYTVMVDIPSVDRRRHSGTFSAIFSRDETITESVTLFTDLIVVAVDDVIVDRKSSVAAAAAAGVSSTAETGILRMRSCSDGISGPWWFSNDAGETKNVPLRSSVPDCVICAAQWRSSPTGRNHPPRSPPEVRITRADGLILGSEESHSVYWYREPGGRASAAVLLLRAPSDEYTGDYICSTSESSMASAMTGSESTRLTNTENRRVNDDDDDERRNKRLIKFRLNVLA